MMPKVSIAAWLKTVDLPALEQAVQAEMQACILAAGELCVQNGRDKVVECEEYALIRALEQRHFWQGLEPMPASLALFAKHFLTRRSAYASQRYWHVQGYRLVFGMMRITLAPFYPRPPTARANPHAGCAGEQVGLLQPAGEQAIAEFYGDLTVLSTATEASVNALLSQFWQRYDAFIHAGDAYHVLGLTPEATWLQIRKAYQLLAAKHHPDKGGNAEQFTRIKTAYDQLKALQ